MNNALKCVFIDQAFPFDYDYDRDQIERPNPFIYFKKLGEYFDSLGGVLILEHPQSDYDSHDWWGGRPRIKGRTKELVEEASTVFAHYSKALEYVKTKDIRFLSYPELHWLLKDRIERKAKEYGKEVVYL